MVENENKWGKLQEAYEQLGGDNADPEQVEHLMKIAETDPEIASAIKAVKEDDPGNRDQNNSYQE
ncbi:MAG TPA: hypothetical protein VK338_05950 [Candidatus Nitrosocosmicus sp.]|nr:hypothetical protein [Candidatus Nitrosocosmicus sp.]